MEKHEINQLIKQSLQSDRNAFRLIVENYQYMIFSLAFRILCNEEDAKDIVQETFIRIWTHLKDFNQNQKFSTWTYRIAVNLCLDKLKKQSVKVFEIDDKLILNLENEDFEEKLTNIEISKIIVALIGELSPKQKIVFTLRYLEELEIEEIKQITGMTSEKIKSNLYVAKQTIRKKLERY